MRKDDAPATPEWHRARAKDLRRNGFTKMAEEHEQIARDRAPAARAKAGEIVRVARVYRAQDPLESVPISGNGGAGWAHRLRSSDRSAIPRHRESTARQSAARQQACRSAGRAADQIQASD